MKVANIFTFLSWVATSTVISLALFSTPYMSKIAAGKAIESLGSTIFIILIVSVICGIPWFRLIFSKSKNNQMPRKVGFSILSFCIALLFYSSIATAPMEGIGYNILFCVLLILIVYPITRILNTNAKNL